MSDITKRKLRLSMLRIPIMVASVAVIAYALVQMNSGSRRSCISGLCRYDVGDLDKTDPALIGYTEAAPVETGLRQPRGVAVGPGDAICVAGDRLIRVFDKAGVRRSDVAVDGEPRCLAVDPAGTIYAGLRDRVAVFDRNGVLRATWQSLGESALLTSIALAGDEVIAADAGNRVVLRLDSTGGVINRIGEKDPKRNIEGLILPSAHLDVALAADSLLRVSNPGRHRIELYTLEGDLERSWGEPSMDIRGFSGCCNPTDFALLPGGRIATSEKGLARVKVYEDITGQFECVVAGTESFTEGVEGLDLAVDSAGRLLVLDPDAKAVRIFTAKGEGKADGAD